MSRTGGFGLAVLLREELIRELFTDTESLFSPSTGMSGQPAVVLDRQEFDWPQLIQQVCNQAAATPMTLQTVAFRRTAPIAPTGVRLENLQDAGGVRLGISAAFVDRVIAPLDISLLALPANSVRFDFDVVLETTFANAPQSDPLNGKPMYRPTSNEYSDSFREAARVFWKKPDPTQPGVTTDEIVSGSSGAVFDNPFVRRDDDDRELVHQDGTPLTNIGSASFPHTQVRIFSFSFLRGGPLSVSAALAPGPTGSIVTGSCLIDPNDPATNAALAAFTAAATGAAQITAAINLFGLRVAQVAPIPHIWLRGSSAQVASYSPGFLTGVTQPNQPVLTGPISNLNLSLQSDFETLLGQIVPLAFAAPFAPLALSIEALGEGHPFAFSSNHTKVAAKTFQPGEPNEKRALVIGTSIEGEPLGSIDQIDDTLAFSDFAVNVSQGVVNAALARAKRRFAREFDSNTRDLSSLRFEFGNNRMEVKLNLRWWVVGSKNSEIQDAVDVSVSNVFVEPRAFFDYAKDANRRPVDLCAIPIPDPPSTQQGLEDPANPVNYFAFVYRRACASPLGCIPPADQLSTVGRKCLEVGHDRDQDGIYDAPNDLDELLDRKPSDPSNADPDDDNDGVPDEPEAKDTDHDGRYGEQELPAEDDDHDGRAGEYEDCDLDNDGRQSEYEAILQDIDGDGRSGEKEPQASPFLHPDAPQGADDDQDFRRCEDEFRGEDLDGDGRIGEREERFGDFNADGDETDAGDPDDDADGIPDENDVDPTYERTEIDDASCPAVDQVVVGTGGAVRTRCRDIFYPEARKVPDFQAFEQLEHIRGLSVGLDLSNPQVSVGNGIVGAIITALDFVFNGGVPLIPVGNLLGHPGRVEKRDGPFSFLFISILEALVPTYLRPQLQGVKPKHSEEQLVQLMPIADDTFLALFVTGLTVNAEAITLVGRSTVLHDLLNPDVTHPTNCAIATAAYGSPLADEIQWLREFRDRVLVRSLVGRALIRGYYRNAPPVARWLARRPIARAGVRRMLAPVVYLARYLLTRTGGRS